MAPRDDISQRVAELTRTLFAQEDLEQSLCKTAHLAVGAIPHCDAASVTMTDGSGHHTRCSTDEVAKRVDYHQYDAAEGPCLDAIRLGESVLVKDLSHADDRWPRFVPCAVDEGMVSAYALPLSVSERLVGALNLYSLSGPFDEGDAQPAEALSAQAAVTLVNAQAYHQARQLVGHLEEALKSRDVIGQAKGIIMERERCTADQAFATLRWVSQTRNVKLRDVAEMVVLTGAWPTSHN